MSDQTTSTPAAGNGAKTDAIDLAKLGLESARESLAKLPILGPALWLYGRDPQRKYTFMADIDGLVLPPVILDQCRVFSKNGIPVGFFTWACVTDEVHARFRAGDVKLAPHEWRAGPHIWLIDTVSPFSPAEALIEELCGTALAGQLVHAWRPDPAQGGKPSVQSWRVTPAPGKAAGSV